MRFVKLEVEIVEAPDDWVWHTSPREYASDLTVTDRTSHYLAQHRDISELPEVSLGKTQSTFGMG